MNKLSSLQKFSAGVLCLFALLSTACAKTEQIFIASGGKGIYSAQLDLDSGTIVSNVLAFAHAPTSFLAVSPNHHNLYAVGHSGKEPNMISAFAIGANGQLAMQNELRGEGDPCHVSVADTGKYLFAANYGGGSVSSCSLAENGFLKGQVTTVQHHGSSVNQQRQAGPHGHCIITDPGGHHALACDLGLDKVLIYQIKNGELTANDPPFASLKPGAGPRHIALNPSGRWAYVVDELDSTMTVFSYNKKSGAMKVTQTLSTIPAGTTEKNYPAEVVVSPSGKFVYGSNRGHDSIAVFAVDQKTGKVTPVEFCPTLGKTPRHFEIDPTGKFLLAANQDSGSVVVFRIDQKSGKLAPTGHVLEIKSPMCVKCLPTE